MAKTNLVLERERIEDIEKKASNGYHPNEEEQKILTRVNDRYAAMRDANTRNEAKEEWEYGHKEYDAYIEPLDDDDERANINKPISFSIIETELQETIDRRTIPSVDPRKAKDKIQIDFINDVLRYSFDVGDFDFEHYQAKKEALISGTSFLMEFYRVDERIVEELVDVKKNPETGELEEVYEKKRRVDFDDCYAQWVSNEFIFVDPDATHIKNARDYIWKELIDIDEFRRKYSLKRGFSNIEYVTIGGKDTEKTTVDAAGNAQEDKTSRLVSVLHYYNRAIDRYDVVANGVVIRKGALPFPHKELNLTVYYCYKDPTKFYGKGIPKLIQALAEERNTISNQRIDTVRQALNKMFFYDDELDLDDLDFTPRSHGGIPVATNGQPINQKLMWLEYSDVKLSGYREEEIIIEDIRRTTGVDDRLQGVNMGGTATEAAILKESSMKRINAKMRLLEMDTLKRLGRLRLANIAFYYPIGKIETITNDEGEEDFHKRSKEIWVDGKNYFLDEKGNLDFERTEGANKITLDKKMSKFLDGEFDITISVDDSGSISKPLQQTKVTEMLKTVLSSPQLALSIDPDLAVKRFLEVNDEDPKLWMPKAKASKGDTERAAELENRLMANGRVLPPTPGATPDHTLVHLVYAKSGEFERVDDDIKSIFQNHINGEAQAQGKLGGQAAPGSTGAPSPQELPQAGMNRADVISSMGGNPGGM